jgi:hypothetical protein
MPVVLAPQVASEPLTAATELTQGPSQNSALAPVREIVTLPEPPPTRPAGLDIRAALAADPAPEQAPVVVVPPPPSSTALVPAPASPSEMAVSTATSRGPLPKLRFPDLAPSPQESPAPARPPLTQTQTQTQAQLETNPQTVFQPEPTAVPAAPPIVANLPAARPAPVVAPTVAAPQPEPISSEILAVLPTATQGHIGSLVVVPVPALVDASTPALVPAASPTTAPGPSPEVAPAQPVELAVTKPQAAQPQGQTALPEVASSATMSVVQPTATPVVAQPAQVQPQPVVTEPVAAATAPAIEPSEPEATPAIAASAAPAAIAGSAAPAREPLTFIPVTPADATPVLTVAAAPTQVPAQSPDPAPAPVPALASDPDLAAALVGGSILPAPAPGSGVASSPSPESAQPEPAIALPALDRQRAMTLSTTQPTASGSTPATPSVADEAFAAAVASATQKLAALTGAPATPAPQVASAAPVREPSTTLANPANPAAATTPTPTPAVLTTTPAPTPALTTAPATPLARAPQRLGNDVRPAPSAGSALDPFTPAAQPIAMRVLELSGTPGMVQLLSEGGPDWTIAEPNLQLTGKFTIRTGGDAGALVELDKDARLRVGRLTRVDVRALADTVPGAPAAASPAGSRRIVVALTRGRVAVTPAPGRTVNVYTPQSMIAVREPTEIIHDTAAGTRTLPYTPAGVAEVPVEAPAP